MSRPPRYSPLKAGLVWFGATIGIGFVVFIILFLTVLPRNNAAARGQLFGQGLAFLSICSGILAAIVQHLRWNSHRG